MCFDLIEKWVSGNLTHSMIGTDGGDLNISGIAAYQPFDGLTELKVVSIEMNFFTLGACLLIRNENIIVGRNEDESKISYLFSISVVY